MNRKEWGKEIKKALIDKDMTQNELADKLGVSRVYVSQIIGGKINYRGTMEKISSFCGVEPYQE